MSTPNATILEIGSRQSPFWQDLFYGDAVKFDKGYALPPDRSGLGLDLDESVAARYPYQPPNWRSGSPMALWQIDRRIEAGARSFRKELPPKAGIRNSWKPDA